ncbi:MAG TPA: hypothetical protein VFO69_12525 [Allosphingosinicella sp.]|nr:hypothetical protein [Allosphingosinicella sp.]
MRKLTIAGVLAAELLAAAQPAVAADLVSAQAHDAGLFAGVRVRLSLDGETRSQRIRAGVALAPTLRSRSATGEVRTRFGEGLEFGVRGREPLQLSIAGTPASQLVQGKPGPSGDRAGVSTLGWVAIGVGALVAVVLVAGAICLSDSDCIPSE